MSATSSPTRSTASFETAVSGEVNSPLSSCSRVSSRTNSPNSFCYETAASTSCASSITTSVAKRVATTNAVLNALNAESLVPVNRPNNNGTVQATKAAVNTPNNVNVTRRTITSPNGLARAAVLAYTPSATTKAVMETISNKKNTFAQVQQEFDSDAESDTASDFPAPDAAAEVINTF